MSRKIKAIGKSIENREIALLSWEHKGILRQAMSETIHLTEGETIIQKQYKIADILTRHSLRINAPAVSDLNDHASIPFIKENISPNEFFNFS